MMRTLFKSDDQGKSSQDAGSCLVITCANRLLMIENGLEPDGSCRPDAASRFEIINAFS